MINLGPRELVNPSIWPYPSHLSTLTSPSPETIHRTHRPDGPPVQKSNLKNTLPPVHKSSRPQAQVPAVGKLEVSLKTRITQPAKIPRHEMLLNVLLTISLRSDIAQTWMQSFFPWKRPSPQLACTSRHLVLELVLWRNPRFSPTHSRISITCNRRIRPCIRN